MVTAHATPARRMGPPGSAIWSSMLDGAEAILRDEGYAALTSRRVAERIGVKQRLVYYYFHTMDDLIVATFQRLSRRELERLSAALASARPLREVWEVCIHTSDARLISEFMALANRIDALRAEVILFVETSRALQVTALSSALAECRPAVPMSPAAIALFATSIALSLTRETELGVATGHDDARAVIEGFLMRCEPA